MNLFKMKLQLSDSLRGRYHFRHHDVNTKQAILITSCRCLLTHIPVHYYVRQNAVLMQTELRFLGQAVAFETPNCVSHRIQQGQTRMTSSPLLIVTLFGKRVELFFTATHLLNLQRNMSRIRSKKSETRSDFCVVICSILLGKRRRRSYLRPHSNCRVKTRSSHDYKYLNINATKDVYFYSFFPRTLRMWNKLYRKALLKVIL